MTLDGIENLWKTMICRGDCLDWIGTFEENKLSGLIGRRTDEGWAAADEWMDGWNDGGRKGVRAGEWSDVSCGDGCYKIVQLPHPSSANMCVSVWPLRPLGGPTCSNIDVAAKLYPVFWLFLCVCLTAGTNSLSWCLQVLLVNKLLFLCVCVRPFVHLCLPTLRTLYYVGSVPMFLPF